MEVPFIAFVKACLEIGMTRVKLVLKVTVLRKFILPV